jgi:hypothetical protein
VSRCTVSLETAGRFRDGKTGGTPMMKELTHFIGGKHANGTSVRFCDGFEPL